ncbi:MAG: Rieske (2Fe-2S) protein [Chloroflexi bacterium]|nr:Rieske (2Fe-2S) protein [Chloroflexota bacterium]
MSWTKVLPQHELPAGARKVVRVGQQVILLIHHNDRIYAVDNRCPHLRLPLQKGQITGDNAIICPWHHSAFDLETGDVKAWSPWPPGVGRLVAVLSREKALPVFPTKVENGGIWINLKEQE